MAVGSPNLTEGAQVGGSGGLFGRCQIALGLIEPDTGVVRKLI
jgi:hypothetical protein